LWVDELIKRAERDRLLSKEPVDVKGTKVVPYDLTLRLWDTIPDTRDRGPAASGLKVIVKGERKGQQVTYTADIVGRMAPEQDFRPQSRLSCWIPVRLR